MRTPTEDKLLNQLKDLCSQYDNKTAINMLSEILMIELLDEKQHPESVESNLKNWMKVYKRAFANLTSN